MKKIRVLLADLEQPVRDLYRRALGDQPDMEVATEISEGVGLLAAIGRTNAHVVILGLENCELPGICSHLFSEWPHTKIVGVTRDRTRAFLFEVLPRRTPIRDASPEVLVGAIREVVRSQFGQVNDRSGGL